MRHWLPKEILRPFTQASAVPVSCRRRPSTRYFHIPLQRSCRGFHATRRRAIVKPYLLADIGEGITECQIIQWYVEAGARVEQFDKICEVQSDKASVEITSRFDGVIKKLYYEADDMAKVGKPLVDIDIQSEISTEDENLTQRPDETTSREETEIQDATSPRVKVQGLADGSLESSAIESNEAPAENSRQAPLATPAVRGLAREFRVDITQVPGTGKEGRVLKEDVQRYTSSNEASRPSFQTPSTVATLCEDKTVPLTPVQAQMFKTLTKSLSIPHFLYTDHVDLTVLTALRKRLNTSKADDLTQSKLSALPFIVKALSIAMKSFPQLNAHINVPETSTSSTPKANEDSRPTVTLRASHDIGIAMDTPSGLLVPVVRAVQSHTIQSLAIEINRLAGLARGGKLTSSDLSGATITVSNIGSIGSGGGAVAPVIVPPQVAILGVGRARAVPAFNAEGQIVKKEECIFSWSADHRVLDGAVVARCASLVRQYLEAIENMFVRMK